MDIVRSWLAAVLVYAVGGLATAAVGVSGRVTEQETGGDGTLIWAGVPVLLTFLLMTLVAGAVHPAPARRRPRRHAVAALGVPLALALGGLVYEGLLGELGEAAVSTVAAVLGTAAGWGAGMLPGLARSR